MSFFLVQRLVEFSRNPHFLAAAERLWTYTWCWIVRNCESSAQAVFCEASSDGIYQNNFTYENSEKYSALPPSRLISILSSGICQASEW